MIALCLEPDRPRMSWILSILSSCWYHLPWWEKCTRQVIAFGDLVAFSQFILLASSILVYSTLKSRYDLNQFMLLSLMPKVFIFSNKILMDRLENAAFGSNDTTIVNMFFSWFFIHSAIALFRQLFFSTSFPALTWYLEFKTIKHLNQYLQMNKLWFHYLPKLKRSII